VVRLIRSKGVGVYFVTQNPLDLPEKVLGQLGNRVQHALRAFTPRDQRAVKAAAETFRPNPRFDSAEVVANLGVGEALVSFLDETGAPTVVERVRVRPPRSRVGPLKPAERQKLIESSPFKEYYAQDIDRESAYELLRDHYAPVKSAPPTPTSPERQPEPEPEEDDGASTGGYRRATPPPPRDERNHPTRENPQRRRRESSIPSTPKPQAPKRSAGEEIAYAVMKELGGRFGRQIVRGVLGAILKR